MPVLVNHDKCNCMPNCFAAMACPNDALHMNMTLNQVTVEPDKCGECPGKCLNFCDSVALKFAPTLVELAIMRKEMAGEITAEQAIEERKAAVALLAAIQEEVEAGTQEVIAVPVKVTTETFMEEVVNAELPVLVDFWAEWCGPCKQIGPIIEELAREFAGQMKFAKLNIDEEPAIAQQLRIQSIPTMMVFYQGQLADMVVGAVPKSQLKQRLQQILAAVDQMQAQAMAPAPAPVPQKATPKATLKATPTTNRPKPNSPIPFKKKS